MALWASHCDHILQARSGTISFAYHGDYIRTHGAITNDGWDSQGGIRTIGKSAPGNLPRTEQGIGMHANALITFDLDEIRRAGLIPADRVLKFKIDRAGLNDDVFGGSQASVHLAVIVTKPHVKDSEFDAIILAEAGLRRLGYADRINALLAPPLMLPAVGQGALGIECRVDDELVRAALVAITNQTVLAAVVSERTILSDLRAGCHAPLGVWSSQTADGQLQLDAVVLTPDGRERLTATAIGSRDAAIEVGHQVARQLREQGADRILVARQ